MVDICSMYNYVSTGSAENSMPHVSYSELRNRLASCMDAVCDSGEPLLVDPAKCL